MKATTRTRIVACVAAAVFGLGGVAFAGSLTVNSDTLTATRTCTLTPMSAVSAAGVDTWVNQNSTGQNNGASTALTVQSRNNQNQRIYIRFDLTQCSPTIPSTATVNAAKLRMVPTAVANQCRTYDIFRVTSAWTETGITWNNQPFGTTLNNPASASRTSFSNIGAAPCENTQINVHTLGWDVTNDVRLFVAGTASNFGWMIRDDIEQSGNNNRTTSFYSREIASIASAQLIVDFTA